MSPAERSLYTCPADTRMSAITTGGTRPCHTSGSSNPITRHQTRQKMERVQSVQIQCLDKRERRRVSAASPHAQAAQETRSAARSSEHVRRSLEEEENEEEEDEEGWVN
ncbi:hypothetical protein Q8A67_024091 [Cirrhinus molitorella]|uniref:Uncharacterized protein n=1 Tax=Cirrhinus molitorella TaxID=172907 RepID=A0AA88P481_9TELE|nr:hypothetical protein Q8A67_024091 [Cirrhinus molitorella]